MVQAPLLTATLGVVFILAGVSTIFSWRKHDSVAEAWMAGNLLVLTVWSFIHILLFSLDSFLPLYLLASIAYPLGPYIAITVFLFAIYFTGREHYMTKPRLAAVLLFPLTLLLFTLTDLRFGHGLAFVNLDYCTADCGNTALTYDFGPALYIYAGFAHALAAIAVYLMYLKTRHSRNVYRKMSLHVLVVTTVLMSANIATFIGQSPFLWDAPFEHMVLLPLSFLLFSVTIVGTTASVRFVQWAPIDALFSKISNAFGDLVPLARDIVIEEIDSGVIVLDETNRVVDVNTMGKKILAPDGRRVVGKRVTDIVPKELFVSEQTHLLEPGVTGRFDAVWIEGVDGVKRCYDISFTEIEESGSDSTSARVALVHDVTEREQRKEKLEEQTRKLEAQNEKLDNFASMVSHDLRNPLNVAEGYVEAVRSEVDEDSSVAMYADEVSVSHNRMREIIEDVLVLAREGQSIEETERLDLADLADTAWSNVDTEGATFECRLEEKTTVDANRSSLLRVLENLFRNSIEHGTPDSPPEPRDEGAEQGVTDGSGTVLTVRIGSLEDGDGFYVEDTGAGIPEDRRDQVLEHGHTTNEEGTGFGLSIVQEISEGHGWSVSVAESPEGGARFEMHGAEMGTR